MANNGETPMCSIVDWNEEEVLCKDIHILRPLAHLLVHVSRHLHGTASRAPGTPGRLEEGDIRQEVDAWQLLTRGTVLWER